MKSGKNSVSDSPRKIGDGHDAAQALPSGGGGVDVPAPRTVEQFEWNQVDRDLIIENQLLSTQNAQMLEHIDKLTIAIKEDDKLLSSMSHFIIRIKSKLWYQEDTTKKSYSSGSQL